MEAKVQSKAATSTSIAPALSGAKETRRPPAIPTRSVAVVTPQEVAQEGTNAGATASKEAGSASGSKSPSGTPAPSAEPAVRLSAAEAARQARGGAKARHATQHFEADDPTTRFNRGRSNAAGKAADKKTPDATARTQFVRGKAKVSRAEFHSDPVVGWLVIVGGPGLGAYRPVFEGNNTLGRASSQRIPIDFGDDTISSEEQAYIRYDSVDRTFLFVPNLAKTNVVQVNNQKPTGAQALSAMDVITMGRTQLVFVPFCGAEFDWSELSNLKE